jgi:hypothetical protein
MSHRFLECPSRVAAVLLLGLLTSTAVRAQSTAFTYQGALDDSGVPTNGVHDFRFKLFNLAVGGVVVGAPVCVDDVNVVDGVFTAQLDFGPVFHTLGERHLEIEVRQDTGTTCGDLTGFVLMSPRQLITAAPFASHANAAFALDAADGVPANAVFVDNAGKVGIGTTTPATLVHLQGTAPVMILQDTASASNQAGYVGFWNNASAETGWMGFGSTGDPNFSVVNARGGGDINLFPGASGNVGIGTASPAVKLDVRGDIKLGASGQLHATSGDEKLRIVRGKVLAGGSLSLGSGFTSSRTSTGVYVVTFTTPFPSTPVLTVSASVGAVGGPFIAQTNGVTTIAAGVRITNGSGTSVDDAFDFIAIGPR